MKKILLDIGGTFIKCSDGREVPVDSNGSREEIASALRTAVFGGETADLQQILVRAAVPGPFDYAAGQFLMKHKYASVYGEYFADIVGLPRSNCKFVHDVNCMLLGEMTSGNGKAFSRVAMVALGTGLGFSISIDGEIRKNALGSPAVSIFSRPFRDGILEDYASKRGIWKLYGDDSITVREIGQRAKDGESRAQYAFSSMGSIIGESIAPIMKEYGIECLLLGGQISRSWILFAPAIETEFSKAGIAQTISPVSDFDNATFNGLKAL